jgi:hypothetical protein
MYKKVMDKLSDAEFFEQMIKDAAKHGINYHELKGLSDEEIQRELQHSSTDGTLSLLEKKIIENSGKRAAEAAVAEKDDARMVTPVVDYLDAIDGPTDFELAEIERIFDPERLKYEPLWEGIFKPKKKKRVAIKITDDSSFDDLIKQIPTTYPGVFALSEELLDFSRSAYDDAYWEWRRQYSAYEEAVEAGRTDAVLPEAPNQSDYFIQRDELIEAPGGSAIVSLKEGQTLALEDWCDNVIVTIEQTGGTGKGLFMD